MRINVAVPEPHVSAPVLDAALEGVTRLNEALIREGAVPPFDDVKHRLRWKPEPPGEEHFDHAGVVLRRGWGDCDDMAPYQAASLRVTGEDPGARAQVRKSGPKRWHALVRRSDGSIDDPSIETGMPAPARRVGIRGAVQPPMTRRVSGVDGTYIRLPELALRAVPTLRGEPEAWQARADLPWHVGPGASPTDVAMVSLHRTPISDQAIVGVCHGAIKLGEAAGGASDYDLDRMAAIRDMCDGATYEEVADEYGTEHADAASHVVGSFFGKIFKAAKGAVTAPLKVAKVIPGVSHAMKFAASPLARTALSFVPGVGPMASMALKAASPEIKRMVHAGRHLPPAQRPAYAHALRSVRPLGAAPHRHQVFTGPPIPL
jgi:hypothetical protein